MRYYAKYFFLFILAVAIFLSLRHWIDRKREKIQDIDIVRTDVDNGDAHLGSWAQKNNSALILLRFKRDSSFYYSVITSSAKDTSRFTGKYYIIPSIVTNNGLQYPRMIAVSNEGDTIINHFIQMTRATKKNLDMLSFKTTNSVDSPSMLFYRIKQ
jgi:hypothetical protein